MITDLNEGKESNVSDQVEVPVSRRFAMKFYMGLQYAFTKIM